MPDALGEELAVVGGVAEEELGRLGPLEVQVGRVLPGEADAAVDLDVLGGGVEVGLGAVGLGQAGDRGQLVVELGRAPGGVVGGGLGRLDLEQHVGALVLDGLEGADGATELHAVLGVLHRHLEHELGAADLLGGEADSGEVEHPLERRPSRRRRCRRARPAMPSSSSLACLRVWSMVDSAVRVRPAASPVDREQRHAGVGPRRHEDQVGGVPVEHEHLRRR